MAALSGGAILLCLTLLVGMVWADGGKTDETISQISGIYLDEMADQMAGQFSSTMHSQFTRVSSLLTNITQDDLQDARSLERFIGMRQSNNNFLFFAVLDEDGYYYVKEGRYPGGEAPEVRAHLEAGEDSVSLQQTPAGAPFILFATPIAPIPFGDTRLTATLVGMEPSFLAARLALNQEDSEAYANIVSREGRYVMRSGWAGDALGGGNLLDFLAGHAAFDKGYGGDALRRQFAGGVRGMAAFTLDGVHQYLYFTPLEGTDWNMCITMPYGNLDAHISGLGRYMMHTALVVILIIVAVILSLFFVYVRAVRRSSALLAQEKAATEDALRLAEQASSAKSEFLSRMSHEIRTPMNGIIGMNYIAMQNTRNPEKVADCLRKISFSSSHLLALLNDVLDMSKIESGRIELRRERVDFRILLEQIAAVTYGQAADKGIRFEAGLSGDVHEAFWGDSLRLSQILHNLLSNALKFTPAGGRVTLRVSETPAGEGRVRLRMEVGDTGCGIEPAHFDKIFQAFEQESGDVTRKYGGTGLGLSITKQFVGLMGGEISVRSTPGEGSTFTAEIPFEVDGGVAAPRGGTGGGRALVVSDAPGFRAHLLHLLGQRGFAAIGAAGLGDAPEGPFALCIVGEPEGSPAQLVGALRGRYPGAKVLLAAYDSAACEAAARAAGADALLAQPVFASALDDALCAARQTGGGSAPAGQPYDFTGLRVLVAEDNAINREIACEIVSLAGAQADTAEDGVQAVEKFSAAPEGYYGLVLMDIQMPRMDGCEATRRIRALPRADARTVPIFAMTANAFVEDEDRSRAAGMDAHISKPFDLQALYAKMSQYLDGK